MFPPLIGAGGWFWLPTDGNGKDAPAMQCLLCALTMLVFDGPSVGLASAPVGRAGQDAPAPDTQTDEIVVTGRRGAADVPPETELGADEIDALGAYDIGAVIRRIAEIQALGDDPIVIVNGQRVADPDVFSRFPPDALVRVEVLPPVASARYGGDPSRRVVNIVLQRRFKSRDGQFEAQAPTAGGTTNLGADLRQGGIAGNNTTQLGVHAERDSALLAQERPAYIEGHPGYEPLSLRPSAETVSGNLALTRPLGKWATSLNVQVRARWDRSISLNDDVPVESRHSSRNLVVIGGLNGTVRGWSLQAALTGLVSATEQSGLADADSRQQSIAMALTASRQAFDVPAGPATVSLSAQGSYSRTTSTAAGTRRTFSARDANLNGTLTIPLWRAPPPGPGSSARWGLGTASLTLGANMRESDAGRGQGLNAGLIWSPLQKLRLNGSWSTSSDSISDTQRFEPEYYGSPITVFDFTTGESAEVLPLLGGMPDLRQPRFDRLSLSVSAGPVTPWSLSGSVSLQRSNAVDSIGALPAVTPELEAAFPDRFRRDANGRLVVIDRRPINFDSVLSESLASNLSVTFPLGSAGPGKRRGTLRVTLNQNRRLRSITTIHAGLPKMDRLSGDGGGMPREQFNLQIDGRSGLWGFNLIARWSDGYRVRRASGEDGPDDLRVSAIGTVNLKLSYTLERALPASGQDAPPRRGVGVQFGLEVDNLFDARPAARLGDGRPAPGYGRDDQDPIGRTIRVTVKGRF